MHRLGAGLRGCGHLGVYRREAREFDPLSLSPFLWVDASDAATVLNASATSATDGQAVATFQDKSGNARHLTQGTAGSRPTLVAASRLISFDGTDDALHKTGLTFSLPFTVILVAMLDTWTNGDTVFQCSTVANVGKLRQSGTTPNLELLSGTITRNTLALGALDIITATFSSTSNQASLRIGEATPATGTCGADSVDAFIVGAANTAGVLGADMKLGEAFIFSGVLGAEDQTDVRSYLRVKWGTP